MLFGYGQRFGQDAIWLQAVPFPIAHISKPAPETLSTIFGSCIFGRIGWRTGSFLHPVWIVLKLICATTQPRDGCRGPNCG